MPNWRDEGQRTLDKFFAEYAANDYNAIEKGYAPKNWVIKDFSLVKQADTWHLFHILGQDGVICIDPDAENRVGHASTADFVTWTTHDPVVPALPGTWESHHIFAPFVFELNHRFHMIYTGINRNLYECLGYAVSSDLFAWDRNASPILDPGNLPWASSDKNPDIAVRGQSPCRDPHVFIEGDTQYLYYSAVDGDTLMPVVGVATSGDGFHWVDADIAYHGWDNSPSNTALLESSCVHKLDSGRYLLTFNTRGCVRYVVGDNPLKFDGNEYRDVPTKEVNISLEVVSRKTDKWLVAYFGGKAGCRMSLGTLEWNGDEIVGGKRIESQDELSEFEL